MSTAFAVARDIFAVIGLWFVAGLCAMAGWAWLRGRARDREIRRELSKLPLLSRKEKAIWKNLARKAASRDL